MSDTLVINEIYLSLQGESTWAGLPCVFIRLTGCNLRCSYCDTAYAFRKGRRRTLPGILTEVGRLATPYRAEPGDKSRSSRSGCAEDPRLPLVELTGGEPLLQPNATELMRLLCDASYVVLLETSGAHDISAVDARVHRIMDLKCPSSGEVEANRWANLDCLTPQDEIKFVIATEEDYAWMTECIAQHGLHRRCPLLVSWASPLAEHQRDPSLRPTPIDGRPLSRRDLAERILADALPVRLQVQLHKVLWPPDQRGV